MTTSHFRAIVQARRDCAVTRPCHVGKPLNLRPRSQRGKYRLWPGWLGR
jgi:hypothetical protein